MQKYFKILKIQNALFGLGVKKDSFTLSTFTHRYVASKAKLLYFTALTSQKCCKIRIFKTQMSQVWCDFQSCFNRDGDAYSLTKVVHTYYEIKFLYYCMV